MLDPRYRRGVAIIPADHVKGVAATNLLSHDQLREGQEYLLSKLEAAIQARQKAGPSSASSAAQSTAPSADDIDSFSMDCSTPEAATPSPQTSINAKQLALAMLQKYMNLPAPKIDGDDILSWHRMQVTASALIAVR
jgi:hypothetical protein